MSGGRGVQDRKGLGRGRCLSVTLEVQVYVCWVSIQYINQNWRNFGVNSKQSLNALSTSSQLPFSCNVDARNHAIWPHRPICECWVPVFFWLGLLLVSLSCCAAGRVWLSRLSQCELVSGEAVQQAMRTDPWCEQRVWRKLLGHGAVDLVEWWKMLRLQIHFALPCSGGYRRTQLSAFLVKACV